jgi:S-adenosylmethionine:tRNA ribosyltransferase-isomerase
MLAAHLPIQRPPQAKLLVVDAQGKMSHVPRARFVNFLHDGDLVIANDAATLPASLHGIHRPSGLTVEVRLAGRRSLAPSAIRHFSAVVFGAGDFHTRTEDRPLPPQLKPGDQLELGPLHASVERILGHWRLVELRFHGRPADIWAGLARYGRPIQYAHIAIPLNLWDVWTPIASHPVAFEPPSAGFVLDWQALVEMHAHGVAVASITHAAGISSTGDAELDRHLPFDEPYYISPATAYAIARARASGGRIVAIGTTVVRAVEHAADAVGRVRAGEGLATQRIHANSRLRVVDAILSGTHEPGTSHYELLRAFTDDDTLRRATEALDVRGYRTHEFGDSVLIEKSSPAAQNVQALPMASCYGRVLCGTRKSAV